MAKGSVTMVDIIVAFIIGAFVGANVSIFGLALCMANKGGDK